MYLVIFDCDGTLVDSQNTIVCGMNAAFASAGLAPPSRGACLDIVGLSLEIAISRLTLPEHQHHVGAMAEAYRQTQIAERAAGKGRDPLYPGARAAIEALHARDDVLLGIATGKALRGVHHMMETHGLHKRFVTIQTADKAPSKPHPGMILQAMGETGVAPENTIMIGDTSFDMEMARGAKVGALGVSWGYHARDLLAAAGAQRVIDDFTELVPLLSQWFGWNDEVPA